MFEGNTLELQHIRMLCERVKCTQEPLPRYIVAFAARIPGSILTSGESLFTVAVPRGIFTRFPLAGASSCVIMPQYKHLGQIIGKRKTRLHEQD